MPILKIPSDLEFESTHTIKKLAEKGYPDACIEIVQRSPIVNSTRDAKTEFTVNHALSAIDCLERTN